MVSVQNHFRLKSFQKIYDDQNLICDCATGSQKLHLHKIERTLIFACHVIYCRNLSPYLGKTIFARCDRINIPKSKEQAFFLTIKIMVFD